MQEIYVQLVKDQNVNLEQLHKDVQYAMEEGILIIDKDQCKCKWHVMPVMEWKRK